MLKKCVIAYYNFFDIHVPSTSLVVLFIASIICAIGMISPAVYAVPDLRAAPENIIWIEGEAYEIQLQKIR